ncbi:uncharacterized protein [Anabrus simplex]|uniref:uncharacterized protein n=1 Tax=Anabrus simplex TaxID=316456 RepID=UPI0035A28085
MEHKIDDDTSFVRMFIDVDDSKTLLSQQDVYDIEKYILDQICANRGKQPHPQLRGYVFSDIEGALIINSHVDSVSWLEQVIKSYKKKELRIRDLKECLQYTSEVQAQVPQLNDVLNLLEAQNVGLQTNGWKILSTSNITLANGWLGWSMTLLIDDAGRKFLEKNNFRLFLGITTITFKLVHTVKRCETTRKIVRIANVQPAQTPLCETTTKVSNIQPPQTTTKMANIQPPQTTTKVVHMGNGLQAQQFSFGSSGTTFR